VEGQSLFKHQALDFLVCSACNDARHKQCERHACGCPCHTSKPRTTPPGSQERPEATAEPEDSEIDYVVDIFEDLSPEEACCAWYEVTCTVIEKVFFLAKSNRPLANYLVRYLSSADDDFDLMRPVVRAVWEEGSWKKLWKDYVDRRLQFEEFWTRIDEWQQSDTTLSFADWSKAQEGNANNR
jgi:hypothetical protein